MLKEIINAGAVTLNATQASKVKITNLVGLITACIAFCYALFFNFSLNQPALMSMNLLFVGAYLITILLSKIQQFKLAKLWFFIALMVHVYILSAFIFSPSSYFHLYYLIIPTGIFVIFDEEDVPEKLFVMLLAIALFFATVNSNQEALIKISEQAEELIFISTVTVIMIEIFFVMSWFNRLVHRYQARLVTMATKDGLTGISNRRTFMSDSEAMMAHSSRYNNKLSLVILDIDHFKQINDTIGHLAGDYVLKQVADVLSNNSRASDCLARYGGEEFVLMLPETNLAQAKETAEHLRRAIETFEFQYQDQAISVTMSFGVTEKLAEDDIVNDMIKRADAALYQAKENGRNQVIAM